MLLLSFLIPALSSGEEPQSRADRIEGELARARQSLHQAHRELAQKAEEIARLEAALAKEGGNAEGGNRSTTDGNSAKEEGARPGDGKGESTPRQVGMEDRLERRVETLKRKLAAQREENRELAEKLAVATESEKRNDSAGSTPRYEVSHDRNSAVNYEGRNAALAFVREQVEADPAVRFRVTGFANDSRYAEANRVAARNRAQFLVAFLERNGVDSERFESVDWEVAESEAGAGGRLATIEVVGGGP